MTMSDDPTRNNAKKTRGRPFEPGNPGRPKGARHKATIAAETLLDGEAEAITRRAIEAAKSGDSAALRLVLERILPPRRDRPVNFQLPKIKRPSDAVSATSAILEAVACGELTPGEAESLNTLIAGLMKSIELCELEARITALEKKGN